MRYVPANIIEPEVLLMLDRINSIYMDAYLAGGYLRDRYLWVPPKDVDFFTALPVKEEHKHAVLGNADSGGGDPRLGDVESYKEAEYLPTDGEYPLIYPVNIVHTSARVPIEEEISHFMFGCMQIAYDPILSKVITTEAFWKDISDKTMTVHRCNREEDAQVGYQKWEMLTKRYHGWRLVVPLQFHRQYEVLVDRSRLNDVIFKTK